MENQLIIQIQGKEKHTEKQVYSYPKDLVDSLSSADQSDLLQNINSVTTVNKIEKYYRFDYDVSDPKKPKRLGVVETTKEEAEKKIKEETDRKNKSKSISSVKRPGLVTIASTSCGQYSGYDCITESWIKVETWIWKINSTVGQTSMRWEWLTNPVYKDIDVFAIGLNGNTSPTPGTESGLYTYTACNQYNVCQDTTTSWGAPAHKRDVGGYAYKVDLDNFYMIVKHKGYMTYKFAPNVSGLLIADAYSHYAHQEKTWSIDPSISMPVGGGLQLSYDSDFDKVTGHAQISW